MNRLHNEKDLTYVKAKRIAENIDLSTGQISQHLIVLEEREKVSRWKETQAAGRWQVDA